jgi:hypothetical protein
MQTVSVTCGVHQRGVEGRGVGEWEESGRRWMVESESRRQVAQGGGREREKEGQWGERETARSHSHAARSRRVRSARPAACPQRP